MENAATHLKKFVVLLVPVGALLSLLYRYIAAGFYLQVADEVLRMEDDEMRDKNKTVKGEQNIIRKPVDTYGFLFQWV